MTSLRAHCGFTALAFLALFAPTGAAHAQWLASAPVVFKEAQVRLLAQRDAQGALRGGIEITLAEGFKTYWKNPGDSGVPPQFDFSASRGLQEAAVRLPFPLSFDDGAGGQAFGYKHGVIFPLSARAAADAVVVLKLDFAVCGTLCIPLTAPLSLPLKGAAPAEAGAQSALDVAFQRLPQVLPPAPQSDIRRVSGTGFVLRLEAPVPPSELNVYPDAPAFFEVKRITPAPSGGVEVQIVGQPQPGHKTLGPLNLTYGTPVQSFERIFDVDAAK